MRNFPTNQRQIPDEVILFPTSLVTEEPSGVNPGAQQPRQTHPPTVNPTRTRSQVQETEQTSNSCLKEVVGPICFCVLMFFVISIICVLVSPIFLLFGPVWYVLTLLNGDNSETTSDNRPHVVVIPPESPWQQNNRSKATAAMATVSHHTDHHPEVSSCSTPGRHHYNGCHSGSYCGYSFLSFLFLLF